MRLRPILRLILILIICTPILVRSDYLPADPEGRVQVFTRPVEFDFVSWTADALWIKLTQAAFSPNRYLPQTSQHELVIEYLSLQKQQADLEDAISNIYANASIADPQQASQKQRLDLQATNNRLSQIGPPAESILQAQVTMVASDFGLTLGGQPVPPIWYHSTPIPEALIVSPRTAIRTDQDISLVPDLPIEQITQLEDNVSRSLDVSALVVPIGGIGIYPTMIMRTDDLAWLTEVIAHEWTHNYLTMRPLGLSYETSAELRTMNETTANISGTEIGAEVLRRYYPELVPAAAASASSPPSQSGAQAAPVFDYRAEMRATRVQVDQYLAAGKVSDAESYMEQRRRFFYEHGYLIRKLNQAYFAFYGAYADQPGGAAGTDPVGPAVRELRSRSASLADFINRISWMTSFDQLQAALR